MGRILIAGFGNVLRGDDGFGVEVVRRLRAAEPRADVEVMEVGTGGIRLAQELLTPREVLIIVDAMVRGGRPGTVYVLEVDSVNPVKEVDMHLAVPSRALSVAQALGALPSRIYMVGCEPAEADELSMELTPAVLEAVEAAIRRIDEILRGEAVGPAPAGGERV
jgi:hydrogenase maturation protease